MRGLHKLPRMDLHIGQAKVAALAARAINSSTSGSQGYVESDVVDVTLVFLANACQPTTHVFEIPQAQASAWPIGATLDIGASLPQPKAPAAASSAEGT